MKRILLLAISLVCLVMSCHETTEGFLITENASYSEDTMYIYKTPDPVKNMPQATDNAPWVTLSLVGYEGTAPVIFSVESITSPDAGMDAVQTFTGELSIRGGGVMEYPVNNKAVPGTYHVSIRLTNSGYSQVVKDAYTFIVVE